jgi:hypothetical protein
MTFNGNVVPEQFNLEGLQKRITLFKPDLVFLDPAITFFPSLEANAEAVTDAYKQLRLLQKQHGCSFILVHHLNKGLRDNEAYEPLCQCYPNPRYWFDHARGTGALVQYADVRIGFDTSTSGTLHVGGYKRATGNLPLVYMDRLTDPEDGTPLAYTRLGGEAMLSSVKRGIYQRLPDSFTATDVKEITGWKNDSQVHAFLGELKELGLVTQAAKRQPYQKVQPAGRAERGQQQEQQDGVPKVKGIGSLSKKGGSHTSLELM